MVRWQKSIVGLADTFLGVEVPVFLYFFSVGLFGPAQQRFIYDRMCLQKFNNSAEICDNIDKAASLVAYENDIQAEYSYYASLINGFANVPAAFVTIFMGALCDRISYRLPITLSHIGVCLTTSLLLLFSFLPVSATSPLAMSLPSLLTGFVGSFGTIAVVGTSYVSKVTTVKNRTYRIAQIEACITLGFSVGSLVCGALMSTGGSPLVFVAQIATNLYAITYVWSVLPELHSVGEIYRRAKDEAEGSLFRYVLSLGNFGIRSKKLRINFRVWMIIYSCLIGSGVIFGIASLTFEFLSSSPISLDASTWAVVQGIYCGLSALNLIVTVRLLQLNRPPFLPLYDNTIALIGAVSLIISLLILTFGDFMPKATPWIYCFTYMFTGFYNAGLKAHLSRVVEDDIRGSLFGITMFAEMITNVLFTAILNAYYAASLKFMTNGENQVPPFIHGSVFFVALILHLFATAIVIWLLKAEKEQNVKAESSLPLE